MKPLSCGILTAALLASVMARAQPSPDTVEIMVRSGVDMAENSKRHHDPACRHSNLYFLASVLPHPSGEALLRPVDAIAIAKELDRLLQAKGFHPSDPDQPPEIVITVEYGRGYLPSRSNHDNTGQARNNLTDSDSINPWELPATFFSLAEQRRALKADDEKLIIQIKAWKYAPDPKEKLRLMWMTSISVEDPEHHDLNELYQKMLAAGAPHFDQPINRGQEVVVNTAVPEGHVKVGTPEIVGEAKTR